VTRQLRVAILDYDAGNVRSARRGFAAAGADARITADPTEASAADALVIPGVGHFASCLTQLKTSGLADVLRDAIAANRPVFGICVGMQLLYSHSEEGGSDGLGLLPGVVRRFKAGTRVPHMGWDVVTPTGHPDAARLLAGIAGERMYFAHSYFSVPYDDTHVVATTTYGGASFPSLVVTGSVVGTQFHPEKSGAAGVMLLANWLQSYARTSA
jgi:imidazole glycerol phosphate synthase glutamine amidotransferase subunit